MKYKVPLSAKCKQCATHYTPLSRHREELRDFGLNSIFLCSSSPSLLFGLQFTELICELAVEDLRQVCPVLSAKICLNKTIKICPLNFAKRFFRSINFIAIKKPCPQCHFPVCSVPSLKLVLEIMEFYLSSA